MEERKYLPPKFTDVLQGLREKTESVLLVSSGGKSLGKEKRVVGNSIDTIQPIDTAQSVSVPKVKYQPVYMSSSRTHGREVDIPLSLTNAEIDIQVDMEPNKPRILQRSRLEER